MAHNHKNVGETAEIIIKTLADLDIEQREAVFSIVYEKYCKYCGSDNGYDCQCWNDE